MVTPLTSEPDRDILRSFAHRIDSSDAGAHNNLGVLYFNKGLVEEAVIAFTRALELDAKMEVARRNLEIAYESAGGFEARIAHLHERLRAHPQDREPRWELARAYAAIGETAAATAEFTTLLTHHPHDLPALVQLALTEKAAGNLEHAQQCLERALALDHASPVVHFYLGEVLYNRGLNDEALTALRGAIERNPDNPDAYFLLGFVLGDMGRHEEAREAAARAVKLNPMLSRAHANLSLDRYSGARYGELAPAGEERRIRRVEASPEGQLAHYSLGLAFRQKGYYSEALREYSVALERGEDRTLVLQATAEVHLLLGEPHHALGRYDELVREQPESPKVWNERGVALHQAGNFVAAGESYRRALTLDADYALAHNNLGVALYHAGESDDAMDAFRTALAAQPTFAKAWLNLALLLYRSKRRRLALEAFRQALQSHPDHPVAWNGIGLVLADLKRHEEARTAFGRAIQGRPEYAEAHYNLSFTLSALGDFDGALRETKRALELDPYYVAQRFELAIDVEYEDPHIAVIPDLQGGRRTETMVDTFDFDPAALDTLFAELTPGPSTPATPAVAASTEAPSYALAVDYLSKGMLDRAAAEATRTMARGASRADGLAILGKVFLARGYAGEALERFREAHALGNLHDALAGQVRALLALARAAEAQPAARALLALNGADVETQLLVARVDAATGDYASAGTLLTRAREAAPWRADILKEIGDVARAAGDPDAALAAYRQALLLDPDLAVVRYEAARLLAARGAGPEAEAELVAALDAVPTYVDAALELSRVRRCSGQARRALDPLVELLHRDPYHLEALLALGETLLDLDRPDDASVAFDRILRSHPNHVAALYYQGAVLASRHRYREAIAYWQQVVVVGSESPYAELARRDARTATDLRTIFRTPAEVTRGN